MNTEIVKRGNAAIAVITSDTPVITDEATAFDIMMSCAYDTDTRLVAIEKSALAADFFKLSTGLAGGILQKFVNYRFRVAIYGDFSGYASKPLKDFIFESNRGGVILFVQDMEQAIARLSEQ